MLRCRSMWLVSTLFSFQMAYGQNANDKHSLALELTNDGFDFVSKQAKTALPTILQNMPIENLKFDIAPIETILINNIKVKADFKSFNVRPQNNALMLDMELNDLVVSIGHVRAQNYIFSSLGTDCYNTKIRFGKNRPVPVHAQIGMKLIGNNLDLSVNNMIFKLDADQYTTSGPDSCKTIGIPDILSQVIVSKVLEYSRSIVNTVINSQMDRIMPLVSKKVNELIAMKIPFSLPESQFLYGANLQFQLKPTFLQIDNNKLKAYVRLDVQRLPWMRKSDKELMLGENKKLLATLGINPEAATRILAAVLANGTKTLEITPDMHELAGQFLKKESLVEFWPDLSNVESDQENMKLFVSLAKAPVLKKNDDGSLLVEIPQLNLDFQVSQNGQYRPYYNMRAALNISTTPVTKDGFVTISNTKASVAVNGEWPNGYAPSDETFRSEIVRDFLKVVLELAAGNFVNFELPKVPVDQNILTLDHLQVADPFVSIDVISHQQ